jgi:hypothetical protein
MLEKVSRDFKRQNLRGRYRIPQEAGLERVGRLPSEVKVNMTIDLTDAMVHVCAEGIRARNPNVTEEELKKKLRERFAWAKRWQKLGRTGKEDESLLQFG